MQEVKEDEIMQIYDLRVNNLTNPLGIGELSWFSWKMKSEDINVIQTAYRITVSQKDETIVWDSGKVNSEQSCFINYEGGTLCDAAQYRCAVTVWDNKGKESKETVIFETALPKAADWDAKWAESPFDMGKRENLPGKQPPATLFCQKMSVDEKPVEKARLYATAHGVYRPYLNGERVDNREFAPENTSYPFYLCYQTYDVTSMVKAGENRLELYVGDGWYCCPNYRREDVTEEPVHAVLFRLEITYEDGSKEIVLSDENVKAAQSQVRYSDIFNGEMYDANEVPVNWQPAVMKDYGYENLQPQPEEPVRCVAVLEPEKIFRSPKGELIVDFGQVISGRVRIKIDIPKGEKVCLDHYEVLDAEGNCYDNLKMLKENAADESQRDIYISAGKEEWYEPYYTFHGFRYLRVMGIEEVGMEDVKAVVLSTDKKNCGTFSCSDEKLNRLYENTRWSQRANMMSIPTDCPQREKAGWTGDIAVYAKTALLNEDVTGLLERWLKNLALEQDAYGAVPFVVPYAGHYPGLAKTFGKLFGNKGEALTASSGWGDAAVIVPYTIYQITGNIKVLERQYDSMKAWCDYIIRECTTRRGRLFAKKEIDKYLWNTGFHWGEWLIPSLSKNGFDVNTILGIKKTLKYIAPSYAYQSIRMMADIAQTVGKSADTNYYADFAEHIKEAFAKGMITKDGKMKEKYMGAYVVPLAFGLVPEEYRENFANELVRMIEENEYCLDTGFLATPFLLPVLQKIGRIDLAYRLLYQTKCPSWLYEVEHGATTIWESWYGYSKEGKPLDVSMNHYAFGCVDEWMFETINGIRNAAPGFKKIIIQPQPDERLTWAKRTFESSYGLIVSEWKRTEDGYHLFVEIPCNTSAGIILPDGQSYEKGSGKHEFRF